MKVSKAGRDLIKRHEGLRLDAYRDPVGIWTIGYGHTGHEAFASNTISPKQAELLLTEDLREAEDAIARLVRVNLSEGQFDALASFVLNVGAGAFAKSTMLRKLNAGEYEGAGNEFGRWVYAKGKKLPGLVKRRSEEAALFLAERSDEETSGVIPDAEPSKATNPAAVAGGGILAVAGPLLQPLAGSTPATVATIAAVALLGFVVWRLMRR